MPELDVVAVERDYTIAAWRNLLVMVLRPGVPEAFARVSDVQARQQREYGNRLVSLTILEGDFRRLFSARSRTLAREQLVRSAGATCHMALVVMREGMLASATRTTMNALSALLRLDVDRRTFAAIDPACGWLAPHILPSSTVREVASIAHEALALGPDPTEDRER